MKKLNFVFAAIIALTLLMVASVAQAVTFEAPVGSEVSATVVGNEAIVNWSGIQGVQNVEQYRTTNEDGKGWVLRHPVSGNSAKFNVYEGDRFQLVNTNGEWLFVSPELCISRYAPLKFKGIVCECSHPRGCVLQVQ